MIDEKAMLEAANAFYIEARIDADDTGYTYLNMKEAMTHALEAYESARAGGEWGKTGHEFVRLPIHENEAALMVLLGTEFLQKHAPHRLISQKTEGAEG